MIITVACEILGVVLLSATMYAILKDPKISVLLAVFLIAVAVFSYFTLPDRVVETTSLTATTSLNYLCATEQERASVANVKDPDTGQSIAGDTRALQVVRQTCEKAEAETKRP